MSPSSAHLQTSSEPRVVVVGAGPAGCLCGLLLAEQGAKVSIFDMRDDLRTELAPQAQARQRSISLSLSTRGLTALDRVGLLDVFRSDSVPMYARCVHKLNKPAEIHPYGQPEEHLLSLSRTQLTCHLIDACDKNPSIELFFNHKCTAVDFKAPSVTVVRPDGGKLEIQATLVVGADGAHSRVREAMSRMDGFDYSKSSFPSAYKELPFTADTENSNFPKSVLHIWPRGSTMLIALPNTSKKDNNFTATLFMPRTEFDVLTTRKEVQRFFESMFPDALFAMPNLTDDFMKNPTQSLYTIRCYPYNYKNNAVLIGDAAHTIVPFYGQGCNASMEDCCLLADTIKHYGWKNLSGALKKYSATRKPNADAIADLAIRQYQDMSFRSTNTLFVLKRRVEIILNRIFPKSFFPLYTMVSFSNTPYANAVARAQKQDRMLTFCVGFGGMAFVTSCALLLFRAVSNILL